MHGRAGEQRRDRDAVRPDHAVGQDDDVVAALHRRVGPLAQPLERVGHAAGALLGRVGGVERAGVEALLDVADAADLLQILVGEDRLAHFQPLAARQAFEIEQVRPRPDERDQAHDELLADRIDRRVRHLREVLLEIGVEQLRLVRQRRDRRVGAHGTDRLLAGGRHRLHQQLQVLLRVAEGLLAIEQGDVGARLARLDRAQLFEHDLRALEPVAVGVGGGERRLDLLVGDDALAFKIDQQHLAGLQPPLADDLLLGDWRGRRPPTP